MLGPPDHLHNNYLQEKNLNTKLFKTLRALQWPKTQEHKAELLPAWGTPAACDPAAQAGKSPGPSPELNSRPSERSEHRRHACDHGKNTLPVWIQHWGGGRTFVTELPNLFQLRGLKTLL